MRAINKEVILIQNDGRCTRPAGAGVLGRRGQETSFQQDRGLQSSLLSSPLLIAALLPPPTLTAPMKGH